jgi:hypothetical protein
MFMEWSHFNGLRMRQEPHYCKIPQQAHVQSELCQHRHTQLDISQDQGIKWVSLVQPSVAIYKSVTDRIEIS